MGILWSSGASADGRLVAPLKGVQQKPLGGLMFLRRARVITTSAVWPLLRSSDRQTVWRALVIVASEVSERDRFFDRLKGNAPIFDAKETIGQTGRSHSHAIISPESDRRFLCGNATGRSSTLVVDRRREPSRRRE